MSEDKEKDTPQPQEGEDKTKENEVNADKDVKSLEAQKEHFRTKYEKSEQEKEELKKRLEELDASKEKVTSENKESNPSDSNKDFESYKEKVDKIEFAQQHPNIEPADINEIFTLAKVNSKSPDEALELPMVKAYLKVKEEEKALERASANNSSRSSKGESGKAWNDMSEEEKKAHVKEQWEKAARGEL